MKMFRIVTMLPLVLALGCAKQPAFNKQHQESILHEKLVPAAQKFIERNGLPYESEFGTKKVTYWKFEYFDDGRAGGIGRVKLDNDFFFFLIVHADRTEVQSFKDISVKTHYDLTGSPNEKIKAINSLLLKNKLNDKTALELGRKYFGLQGHREENFHPPECRQAYWIAGNENGLLPYYYIHWHHKSVTEEELRSGNQALPGVTIEVSGITSALLYYAKGIDD